MLRSILRHVPAASCLFSVHAIFFVADPCTSDTDGAKPAPSVTPPVDTVKPADASPYSVFQTRSTVEVKVDPTVAGGQQLDSKGCNEASGDTLLGVGYQLADPGVSLRELKISPDSLGANTFAGMYVVARSGGARAFAVLPTCLHKEKGQASLDIDTSLRGVTPGIAPQGKSATGVSECLGGAWLVGGGLWVEAPVVAGAKVYPRITKLGPVDNAWVIRARNEADGNATIGTTAVCARAKTEVLYPYPSTTFTVEPGKTARGTLSCPAGWSAFSGGFSFEDDAKVDVIENRATPSLELPGRRTVVDGWAVSAVSSDTVPRTVKITLLCGKNGDAVAKAPALVPPSAESPDPDPAISVTPNPVKAFCSNGSFPNALTVKNVGGGNLAWNVTKPTDATNLIVTPPSGILAAGASSIVTLGGQYANGTFVLGFGGNGGKSDVTVQCE